MNIFLDAIENREKEEQSTKTGEKAKDKEQITWKDRKSGRKTSKKQ